MNSGESVALDGDTAVIGAHRSDDSGTIDNGAAYVFTRVGGIWTEQAKLLASDKADGDHFGHSVALDGDTAVIGAWCRMTAAQATTARPMSSPGSVGSGPSRPNCWRATKPMTINSGGRSPSTATPPSSVRIGRMTAAQRDNGAAYVFTRVGGIWTEQAKLLASDKADSD